MNRTKELADSLIENNRAILTKDGKELLNPVPLNENIHLERPPSLKEQIQRVIREGISPLAEEHGEESFEEFNDFDIDDGFEVDEPLSGYEVQELQEEFLAVPEDQTQPEAKAAGEEVPKAVSSSEVPKDAQEPPAG